MEPDTPSKFKRLSSRDHAFWQALRDRRKDGDDVASIAGSFQSVALSNPTMFLDLVDEVISVQEQHVQSGEAEDIPSPSYAKLKQKLRRSASPRLITPPSLDSASAGRPSTSSSSSRSTNPRPAHPPKPLAENKTSLDSSEVKKAAEAIRNVRQTLATSTSASSSCDDWNIHHVSSSASSTLIGPQELQYSQPRYPVINAAESESGATFVEVTDKLPPAMATSGTNSTDLIFTSMSSSNSDPLDGSSNIKETAETKETKEPEGPKEPKEPKEPKQPKQPPPQETKKPKDPPARNTAKNTAPTSKQQKTATADTPAKGKPGSNAAKPVVGQKVVKTAAQKIEAPKKAAKKIEAQKKVIADTIRAEATQKKAVADTIRAEKKVTERVPAVQDTSAKDASNPPKNAAAPSVSNPPTSLQHKETPASTPSKENDGDTTEETTVTPKAKKATSSSEASLDAKKSSIHRKGSSSSTKKKSKTGVRTRDIDNVPKPEPSPIYTVPRNISRSGGSRAPNTRNFLPPLSPAVKKPGTKTPRSTKVDDPDSPFSFNQTAKDDAKTDDSKGITAETTSPVPSEATHSPQPTNDVKPKQGKPSAPLSTTLTPSSKALDATPVAANLAKTKVSQLSPKTQSKPSTKPKMEKPRAKALSPSEARGQDVLSSPRSDLSGHSVYTQSSAEPTAVYGSLQVYMPTKSRSQEINKPTKKKSKQASSNQRKTQRPRAPAVGSGLSEDESSLGESVLDSVAGGSVQRSPSTNTESVKVPSKPQPPKSPRAVAKVVKNEESGGGTKTQPRSFRRRMGLLSGRTKQSVPASPEARKPVSSHSSPAEPEGNVAKNEKVSQPPSAPATQTVMEENGSPKPCELRLEDVQPSSSSQQDDKSVDETPLSQPDSEENSDPTDPQFDDDMVFRLPSTQHESKEDKPSTVDAECFSIELTDDVVLAEQMGVEHHTPRATPPLDLRSEKTLADTNHEDSASDGQDTWSNFFSNFPTTPRDLADQVIGSIGGTDFPPSPKGFAGQLIDTIENFSNGPKVLADQVIATIDADFPTSQNFPTGQKLLMHQPEERQSIEQPRQAEQAARQKGPSGPRKKPTARPTRSGRPPTTPKKSGQPSVKTGAFPSRRPSVKTGTSPSSKKRSFSRQTSSSLADGSTYRDAFVDGSISYSYDVSKLDPRSPTSGVEEVLSEAASTDTEGWITEGEFYDDIDNLVNGEWVDWMAPNTSQWFPTFSLDAGSPPQIASEFREDYPPTAGSKSESFTDEGSDRGDTDGEQTDDEEVSLRKDRSLIVRADTTGLASSSNVFSAMSSFFDP